MIPEKTYLGIELGSTRIKAVLIGEDFSVIASGNHDWESRLENGLWTYSLEGVWDGIRSAYEHLAAQTKERYGISLCTVDRICISAMMHGYLAFDKDDKLLVPFRTWRNTNTGEAASKLSSALNFNIPHRWSAAHFYQAMINGEEHVAHTTYITTLAGYVHWKLTGEKILGVGDASGMFPVDGSCYDPEMLRIFNELCTTAGMDAGAIFPKILLAGDDAGYLTQEGAYLLDPSGTLQSSIPFCPPEGDAGTGMVATNSTAPRTGNVSAGTSIFAMAVLTKPLKGAYPEIDVVATPDGKPVAMVHCNNCTSDLDAWVKVFGEFAGVSEPHGDKTELYGRLYNAALQGDPDCGGLLSYNYISGEPITGFDEGRPLFTRLPDAEFTFNNFARSLVNSALATLRIGMDILTLKEAVMIDVLRGHGGLFKIPEGSRRLMAAALNMPVSVHLSAGEGGAWGAALLAAYASMKRAGEALDAFLGDRVFANLSGVAVEPDPKDAAGFNEYLKRYIAGLEIERAAISALN
ncbi:MAG: FGGY-family carbohydrate kinase [Oscillospiraceae bacterium]|nr:FGGY-family carbohydrate kinase [Oscillospiraceae bacterium]